MELLASLEFERTIEVCVYRAMESRVQNINTLIEHFEPKCFYMKSTLDIRTKKTRN